MDDRSRPSRISGTSHAPGLVIALAILCLGISACGSLVTREPDLERLYAFHAAGPRTPVIVIPGVFGSRLRDPVSSREEWPGGFVDLLTGRRFERLALSVSND